MQKHITDRFNENENGKLGNNNGVTVYAHISDFHEQVEIIAYI